MRAKAVLVAVAAATALALTGCAQPGPSTYASTGTTSTATTSRSATATETRLPTSATSTTTSSVPTSSAPRTTPTPAALSIGHAAWVSVSVATLWRSPNSPRTVDARALRAPADIRGWLGAMTLADRSGLGGRADTQALLGDRVIVTALRGTWAKVVVPDQPTPLDSRGYPGWVPTRQLSAVTPRATAEVVTVVAATTWLRADTPAGGRVVEVSYGTRLPVIARLDGWLRVELPGGLVRRVDAAAVVRHGATSPALRATGSALVRDAQSFTGLPYLWAGRSGFGFDCSGLTSLVMRVHGLVTARDADAQAAGGRRVSARGLEPGDLLFYATSTGYVHHVTMYAGSGLMVQSPSTGRAVQTIPISTPSYAAQFAGARRYLP